MANPVEDMIDRELESWKVPRREIYREQGGRHLKLYVGPDGKQQFVTYSPRCHGRALLNLRSDLRRMLEIVGYKSPYSKNKLGSFGEALLEAVTKETKAAPPKVDPARQTLILSPPPAPIATPKTSEKPQPTAAQAEIGALRAELFDALRAAKEKALERQKEDDPEVINIQRTQKMAYDSRSMLTHNEVAQVTLLISQNASVDTDKKVCNYSPAWSDERILAMIAHGDRKHLSVDNIKKLRREMFGRTQDEIDRAAANRAMGGGMGAVWSRITDIERRLDALEDKATTPRSSNSAAYTSAAE